MFCTVQALIIVETLIFWAFKKAGAERKRVLERESDEIKKENQQRRQEIEQLKEMITAKKDEAEREKKYLKEALEEQEQLKNHLSSDELLTLPQDGIQHFYM